MKANKKTAIFALLGLILILGVTLRFSAFKGIMHDFRLVGDENNYYIMSHQLVDNHTFGYAEDRKSGISNAYVTPGYILFLSAIYAVNHDVYRQVTIVRLLQVLTGGFITPLLAFLLVRRLIRKYSVALLTAFFVAVYPTYVLSATHLLTEVLSLAAMLLYFLLTYIALSEKKPYLNFLAGAAFAVNILIRPTMFPLFVIPFIFACLNKKPAERKKIYKLFAYNLIGFIVLMLPWWVRNGIVMHRLVLLSTESGDPLLAGSYPLMKGVFKDYKNLKIPEEVFAERRIINGFESKPLLYLKWYTVGKIQYMFQLPWLNFRPPYRTAFSALIHNSLNLFHNILIYAGLAGVVFNTITSRINRYINLYAAMFLALLLIFIPVSRYTYHLMFFLMISAAVIICNAIEFIVLKMAVRLKKYSY